MRIPPRTFAWDVAIFSALGSVGDFAQRLHDDLAGRGLRVKLNVAPMTERLQLTPSTQDDAKEAAVCVVLATDLVSVEGLSGGPTEITRYVIASAPRFQGQRPERTPTNSSGGPGNVEVGVLTEDVPSLAARIEARLGGGRSC